MNYKDLPHSVPLPESMEDLETIVDTYAFDRLVIVHDPMGRSGTLALCELPFFGELAETYGVDVPFAPEIPKDADWDDDYKWAIVVSNGKKEMQWDTFLVIDQGRILVYPYSDWAEDEVVHTLKEVW